MPEESKKKRSLSLTDLIAASKRLRDKSSQLNTEIAKLDEVIAEEAAALARKAREGGKRGAKQ